MLRDLVIVACVAYTAWGQYVPLAANGVILGTVSSVAADQNGLIYVLQRGDKADPVIAVNREGRVLRSWGKGMFTVPHSVRVDPEGNIWTVDAGSSVLLKFTPEGKKLQEIDVGEIAKASDCAFPTLCGTTDVTFGPAGRLFISDGYGNARILEYTADGKRVKAWGSKGAGPGQFQIPHGIAFDGKCCTWRTGLMRACSGSIWKASISASGQISGARLH